MVRTDLEDVDGPTLMHAVGIPREGSFRQFYHIIAINNITVQAGLEVYRTASHQTSESRIYGEELSENHDHDDKIIIDNKHRGSHEIKMPCNARPGTF